MCNLYKMTKTVAEVAKLFGAAADPPGNAPEWETSVAGGFITDGLDEDW